MSMYTINNTLHIFANKVVHTLNDIQAAQDITSPISHFYHFHSVPNSFLSHGYCFGHSKHVCKYLYDLSTLLGNLQLFGKSQGISYGSKCRFAHCHGANFSISLKGVGLRIHSTI